jgi:DnaJ-class molecular chaperone
MTQILIRTECKLCGGSGIDRPGNRKCPVCKGTKRENQAPDRWVSLEEFKRLLDTTETAGAQPGAQPTP